MPTSSMYSRQAYRATYASDVAPVQTRCKTIVDIMHRISWCLWISLDERPARLAITTWSDLPRENHHHVILSHVELTDTGTIREAYMNAWASATSWAKCSVASVSIYWKSFRQWASLTTNFVESGLHSQTATEDTERFWLRWDIDVSVYYWHIKGLWPVDSPLWYAFCP